MLEINVRPTANGRHSAYIRVWIWCRLQAFRRFSFDVEDEFSIPFTDTNERMYESAAQIRRERI